MSKPQTSADPAMQMHLAEAARPTAPPSYSGHRGATAGPLAWLTVAAAAVGLLWLFFGKLISRVMSQWGRGSKKGGKWVSDRSLGGRMVRSSPANAQRMSRPSAGLMELGTCCSAWRCAKTCA